MAALVGVLAALLFAIVLVRASSREPAQGRVVSSRSAEDVVEAED